MIRIVGKRIVQLVLVLFGVSLLVFVMLRVLSPDPASIVLGQQATEQAKEEWRNANGLNQSISKQYMEFALGALGGDFGKSYYTKAPVWEEIKPRFAATFELTFLATILACLSGIGIGTLCAIKKNQLPDYIGRIVSLSGVCVPIFFMGILLSLFFGNFLHILPSSGRIDPLLKPESITGFVLLDCLIEGNIDGFADAVKHIILPVITLAMYSMAVIARVMRANMLETMEKDFILTARAKGIPEWKVIWNHGVRNSILPVITVIGVQFGILLGGAVLTEEVFAWPGIGSYMVEAVLKSDFPAIQAVVLLFAVTFVVTNTIVDLLYVWLDPRITLSN